MILLAKIRITRRITKGISFFLHEGALYDGIGQGVDGRRSFLLKKQNYFGYHKNICVICASYIRNQYYLKQK